LVEVAGGYQLTTKQECAPWIRRLEEIRTASRLSKPALETIAIIAYKQPITRPEIEEIRGVDTAGVIKTLLERRLIKIAGRREAVGRPLLYGTTKEFLEYFGLRDLSGLPSLKEFKEVAQAEADPVLVAAEDETAHAHALETNGNK
jgi:segregation and condensation protein B